MRSIAAVILFSSLSIFAADDAVKPPAPPSDVAEAPTQLNVNRQPKRKAPSEEDRAAVAETAKQKREVKKLEKEVAALEKDLAASEAELANAKGAGYTSNEAVGWADKKARAAKKAFKDKSKELAAAKAALEN